MTISLWIGIAWLVILVVVIVVDSVRNDARAAMSAASLLLASFISIGFGVHRAYENAKPARELDKAYDKLWEGREELSRKFKDWCIDHGFRSVTALDLYIGCMDDDGMYTYPLLDDKSVIKVSSQP